MLVTRGLGRRLVRSLLVTNGLGRAILSLVEQEDVSGSLCPGIRVATARAGLRRSYALASSRVPSVTTGALLVSFSSGMTVRPIAIGIEIRQMTASIRQTSLVAGLRVVRIYAVPPKDWIRAGHRAPSMTTGLRVPVLVSVAASSSCS